MLVFAAILIKLGNANLSENREILSLRTYKCFRRSAQNSEKTTPDLNSFIKSYVLLNF